MTKIFKLIIEDDEGKTTVYPLAENELSIGRKEGNTIRLMERNVSRRHARLMRQNGAVLIEDLDSYNGIRINGERINGRYEVTEGDLVEIGDYHLALHYAQLETAESREHSAEGRPDSGEEWSQAGTVPDMRLPENARDGAPSLLETPSAVPSEDALTGDEPTVAAPAPDVTPPVPEKPSSETKTEDSVSGLPPFPARLANVDPTMLVSASWSGQPAPVPGGEPLKDEPFVTGDLKPGPAVVAGVPRIICVSTMYAGKAFSLERAELIIGRVDDNDVVIEHRSVSRSHAKILFDGRGHKIIDLQSANGILVNGEEYAMTDLRHGDLIELGHVKFRFVAKGESFVPTDEEVLEMRSAGLEPQSVDMANLAHLPIAGSPLAPPTAPSPSRDRTVSDFDPSTAQTVTDTPLSALTDTDTEESFVPTSVPISDDSDTVALGPDRMPLSQPPPIPDTHEPAMVPSYRPQPSSAPPPVPTPSSEEAKTARDLRSNPPEGVLGASPVPGSTDTDHTTKLIHERPEPKRSKSPMLLVALIGVLLIPVLAYFGLSKKPSAAMDEALETFYKDRKYEQVVELCDQYQGQFADKVRAGRLCGRAEVRLEMMRAPTPDGRPVKKPVPDETAAPGGQPPQPDLVDIRRPGTPKKPVRAVRSKRKVAKQLAFKGRRALLQGDMASAERLLKECVKSDPTLGECHRNLGVLYAQSDDFPKALRHYKKYLILSPKAPDANRVRQMIREAEKDR